MKFKFNLQAVLRQRKIAEEEAQRNFYAAQAKLNTELEKLEKLKEKKFEARQAAFTIQTSGATSTLELNQVNEFLSGQDVRIERQSRAIELQQQIVEDLRESLRKAAVEYKIIDRYREKKKEEFDTEKKKREQKLLDDMVSVRTKYKEAE